MQSNNKLLLSYDNQCLVDKAGVSTQSNSTCGSNTESTSLNVSNAPNPSFIPNFDHNSTPRTVDPNNTPSLSTSCSSMIFRASNFLLLGYLISSVSFLSTEIWILSIDTILSLKITLSSFLSFLVHTSTKRNHTNL
eukprot:TRINITY_DN2626_c0_g1_i18.p1 TRINITY_DN2626_c0_g1~~TRINITY_DN2626_c0_g1_i18.p1  ORF type:complete len:136 (+),score=16.72 TRINITY_DN2626_c0_g1_i18:757-1164(+)